MTDNTATSDATHDAQGNDPGDTPLSHVVDSIDANSGGADGQFGVIEGAELRCFTCRETFSAVGLNADRVTRLEGASDPSDQAMVVPVTCPKCGISGSLVLNYGPGASPDEADVIHAMDRDPSVGSVGESPTPGISPTAN